MISPTSRGPEVAERWQGTRGNRPVYRHLEFHAASITSAFGETDGPLRLGRVADISM
ncbi:hypothetical protein HBI56_152960 [Parastagonospora nodorum]|uniref:Uncharacterized protein n=1 Tax=Phaeosphaeria nodorum (strain SN15 / ATCC MYA-4574 / FGSC 10173) TaxID=321614 RepID=A0A7U2I707_PHANO|nr:hypothetical protein HBH56_181540 [Parastagonospora nodorum]QRD04265.1 hypothetical protein JI435_129980 [Parastagonospora nodorum SN15]KAH3926051.1 hypothetical protein HBH54_170690 [Parastagonospora nodorum]KAH3944864.1 hypothetical protein HBH53_154230 [Parastagonospora nodorum]KAH3960637.1 hypothetical protein HBH52_235770 [Parastagonospora nodorum]